LNSKVTIFHDISSGGGQKLEHRIILIQLPEREACEKFETLFNRDPNNVTCICCGSDYSISEFDSLEEALGYYEEAYVAPLTPLEQLL
jgi:hypothetical protein